MFSMDMSDPAQILPNLPCQKEIHFVPFPIRQQLHFNKGLKNYPNLELTIEMMLLNREDVLPVTVPYSFSTGADSH